MQTRQDYHANGTLEGDTEWLYDSNIDIDGLVDSLGQLVSVSDYSSGYTKKISYDSLGRPSETKTTLGPDGDHYEKVTYDGYGRTYQVFDAAHESKTWTDNVIEMRYNAQGYRSGLVDGVYLNGQSRKTYQTITAMDARGSIRNESLGGGAASTQRYFDEDTGRIADIISTDALSGNIQELHYHWDILGNLASRQELSGSKNLSESFQYDNLNRLTSYQITGQTAQSVTYDSLGNIKSKSDVGTYTYNYAARPHAVTNAGGVGYSYDANGNTISGDGRSLSYTTFDQASLITKGTHQTQFFYGPDRSRYKRTDSDLGGTITTLYLGGVEKIIQPSGSYQYKRYLGGVVIVTQSYSSAAVLLEEEMHLVFRDHLGSVDVIAGFDPLGAVLIAQELSFDAWGQRRNASDWLALSPPELDYFDHTLTTRGFTGHEMVDEVGIIHMNGRIYDPKLGRFLQADPFIQDAFDTQLFNRYSYTRNNPLNATDPSGYIIPVIVGIILIAAEVELVTAVIIMGVTVFADTLIRGGSLQDAFLAGISAAAMTYVGGRLFPQGSFGLNSETFRFVATVATVGGITASLQGGNFGNGFMTAGISAAVGGAVGSSSTFGGSLGPSGRIIAKAVVGGTLSHISGGKFANGAITAAFAYAVSYGVEAVKASYRPQGAIDNSPVVVPEGYEGSIPKAAAEMITAAEPDLADAVDKATIMQGADSDFEGLKDSVPAFARNTTIVIRPGKSLSLYVLSHEIDHVYRYLTVPDFNYKYSEQTKLLRSIGYTEDEAYYGNSYEKRAEIRARSVMRYHNICMRPDCAE